MPLYEYRCKDCGEIYEVIQKFSDQPLTECPKCKGTLEKLLSAPAIQFKGSGWYITDYSRKGSSPESKGEASDKDSASEKGSTEKESSKGTADSKEGKTESASKKTKAADTNGKSSE